MDKRYYLLLTAAFIFLTDSTYRVDKRCVANNNITVIQAAGDKSVGHSSDKIFITNFTCGGNLSN